MKEKKHKRRSTRENGKLDCFWHCVTYFRMPAEKPRDRWECDFHNSSWCHRLRVLCVLSTFLLLLLISNRMPNMLSYGVTKATKWIIGTRKIMRLPVATKLRILTISFSCVRLCRDRSTDVDTMLCDYTILEFLKCSPLTPLSLQRQQNECGFKSSFSFIRQFLLLMFIRFSQRLFFPLSFSFFPAHVRLAKSIVSGHNNIRKIANRK